MDILLNIMIIISISYNIGTFKMAHSSTVISYIMFGDLLNDSNFLRTKKKPKT